MTARQSGVVAPLSPGNFSSRVAAPGSEAAIEQPIAARPVSTMATLPTTPGINDRKVQGERGSLSLASAWQILQPFRHSPCQSPLFFLGTHHDYLSVAAAAAAAASSWSGANNSSHLTQQHPISNLVSSASSSTANLAPASRHSSAHLLQQPGVII